MAWKSGHDLRISVGVEESENDDILVFHQWSFLSPCPSCPMLFCTQHESFLTFTHLNKKGPCVNHSFYTCIEKRARGFMLAFLERLARPVTSKSGSTDRSGQVSTHARSGLDLPRGNVWRSLRIKGITLNMSSS